MRYAWLGAGLLAFASCASSQPRNLTPQGAIGLELFERHRAIEAARTVVEDGSVGKEELYAVEQDGDGWRVIVAGRQGDSLVMLKELRTTGRRVVDEGPGGQSAPLPEAAALQLLARQVALEAAVGGCSNVFETVALPLGEVAAPSAFDVYVLSAHDDPAVIMIGGHSRVRVSASNLTVVETEQFSRQCAGLAESTDTVLFGVYNDASEEADEINVFLSLRYDVPMTVLTTRNGRAWLVDGADVELLSEAGERP